MSKIKNLFSRFVYLFAIFFITIITTNCNNDLSLSNAEFKVAFTMPGECAISRTAKSASNSEWTVKIWIEQDDAVILQTKENTASSGETVSFTFNNILVGSQIRVCAEISNIDNNDTVYNGQTEFFIVQKGQNKKTLTLKLSSSDSEQPDEETLTDETSITVPVLAGCDKDGMSTDFIVVADSSSESDKSKKIINSANNDNVTSVWDYNVAAKPDSSSEGYSFIKGNNTVSVQLKADQVTVVGIAAARADMFFTVGTEWKTYTFQTGYLKEDLKKEITIGIGLSKTVYVRNLSVTPIKNSENQQLPSLSIMISKAGIQNYLKDSNRANNIVDYLINNDNSYSLNLNATGVTVELRSYVPNIGLNKASFDMTSENQNLATSVCANIDYAYNETKKAFAWNANKTVIGDTEKKTYNALLPCYEQNEPCKVTVISESNDKASITIGNLQVVKIDEEKEIEVLKSLGKSFYIFENGVPHNEKSLPLTINNSSTSVSFDVLVANTDCNEDGSFDWNECVRFYYVNNADLPSGLSYTHETSDQGDSFILTNTSGADISCLIELTDDYTVNISLPL